MKSILAGPRKGVALSNSPAHLGTSENLDPAHDTVEVPRLAPAWVSASVGGFVERITRHRLAKGLFTYRGTARASHIGDALLRMG